jgi:hypothetical protein
VISHWPFSILIVLVRLAGFEPTTPWFVAKYSIQLSYSRSKPSTIALNYPTPQEYSSIHKNVVQLKITVAIEKRAVISHGPLSLSY